MNKKTLAISIAVIIFLLGILFVYQYSPNNNVAKVDPLSELYKQVDEYKKDGKVQDYNQNLDLVNKGNVLLGVSGDKWLSAESQITDLRKTGIDAIRKGDYAKAKESFLQLAAWQPDDSQNYVQLGVIAEKQNDPGTAIAIYKKAIELNGKSNMPSPYLGLARVYISENLASEAIIILNDGIKINPSYPDFYYNLVTAYSLIGDAKNAEASSEMFKKLMPSISSPRVSTVTSTTTSSIQ